MCVQATCPANNKCPNTCNDEDQLQDKGMAELQICKEVGEGKAPKRQNRNVWHDLAGKKAKERIDAPPPPRVWAERELIAAARSPTKPRRNKE